MNDLHRVCIQVKSVYVAEQSLPDEQRYVFCYTITIRNLGHGPVQLLERYWEVTNGNNHHTKIHGEGVVGEQPCIDSGSEFQYSSGVVLETPIGTMQGYYIMADMTGLWLI